MTSSGGYLLVVWSRRLHPDISKLWYFPFYCVNLKKRSFTGLYALAFTDYGRL